VSTKAAAISIVIPTLNEAAIIESAVTRLLQCGHRDIVVADAQSTDGTATMAAAAGARVVSVPTPGRGHQLAAGVNATRAPLIVLLHADTRLPDGAGDAIANTLAEPSIAGGAFRLRFDAPGWKLAACAWCSRFETPLTTFGDQAFFTRRDTLAAVGGVPAHLPLFEDMELRRRLKTAGRFVKLPLSVTTSARGLLRRGVVRAQVENAALITAHRCGVSVERLAAYYRRRS